MLLDLIAGARPNFVKLAPIIRAVEQARAVGTDISYRFIHTGQHSSTDMSAAMLHDLKLPAPHVLLECSGDTRAAMLACVIKKYDEVLRKQRPSWTVVVGDVTSTLGATLAAKAADVRVAHVEAGLRSGDRTMPEELNRIATDALADLHFTTSRSAGANLLREGVAAERIHVVGNVMVDSLLHTLPHLKRPTLFDDLSLTPSGYGILTLHRPVNVDDPVLLCEWLSAVAHACPHIPIVFPVHPRTLQSLPSANSIPPNIWITAPLPYATFLYLQQHSSVIITDSGGLSEEATILRRPCVTLRATTERPETVLDGTNVLAATPTDFKKALELAYAKTAFADIRPEFWDGQASKRVVNVLASL